MNERNTAMDRLEELLIEEAATGLDTSGTSQLEELMAAGTGLARDDFMTVASLVQLGFLHHDPHSQQRLPDALRARLTQQADQFFRAGPARNDAAGVTDLKAARDSRQRPSQEPSRWLRANFAGWYLAAALALAFVVFRGDMPSETAIDPAAQRAALLELPGTVTVAWAPGDAAAGYEAVSGDVVWNTERQAGFMRLSGLVANAPAAAQYQLWIVDPSRDERPVDGGVFDVPTVAGDLVIPIDPKLRIDSPAAFAITLEQPGGVVVSQGPLLVVAPVAG